MGIVGRGPSLGKLSFRERWRFAAKARPERYWDNEPEVAAQQLKTVCRENPEDWLYFYLLADYALKCVVAVENGSAFLGTAISAARRAHELNPHDSRTAFALATAFRMRCEYPGPEEWEFLGLGEFFSLSKNEALAQAITYFERTLQLGVRGRDKRIVHDSIDSLRQSHGVRNAP